MSLVPEMKPVRELIDRISSFRDSFICKFFYLCAARPAEVVTKIQPSEITRTQALGRDIRHTMAKFQDQPIFLITMKVVKKKKDKKTGKSRTSWKVIALPAMPQYEPWTYDLLKYLTTKGSFGLDLNRKYVSSIIRGYLEPLEYDRSLKNPLRHFRLSHLMNYYNFFPNDLAAISGHSLTYQFGAAGMPMSSSLEFYLHQAWRNYLPKLLKPLEDVLKGY